MLRWCSSTSPPPSAKQKTVHHLPAPAARPLSHKAASTRCSCDSPCKSAPAPPLFYKLRCTPPPPSLHPSHKPPTAPASPCAPAHTQIAQARPSAASSAFFRHCSRTPLQSTSRSQ